MLQLYTDQIAECPAGLKRLHLHLRIVADLLQSVPRERYLEYRRRLDVESDMPLHRALRRVLVVAPNPAFALLLSVGVLGLGLVRKALRWRRL